MKIYHSKLLAIVAIVLAAFSLLFRTTATNPYDPCRDINNDGKIDIKDIADVASRFGTLGEPYLLKAGLLNDSGWIDITHKCGQYYVYTHNLNSTDMIVETTGKTTLDGGVHQRDLGGTGYKLGWSRTFGGTEWDEMTSMVKTSDGGYGFAGFRTISGHYSCWLVKTDALGNKQWDEMYKGAGFYSLVQTRDGGYALAGDAWSNEIDFWLVKTDAAGNMQWNKTYGGLDREDCGCVIQTSDGGYALVGRSLSFSSTWNILLVKTDSSGDLQWSRTFGGLESAGVEAWGSVVQTNDGGYAIAGDYGSGTRHSWLFKTDVLGYMQWNKTYDWGARAKSLAQTADGGYVLAGDTLYNVGAGSTDFWLAKTDAIGNLQWNKTYGGYAADYACSVVQTSEGGYAVAGHSSSFDVPNNYDAWLVKTDSTGNIQWNQTYGGTEHEFVCSVSQTADGGLIVGGKTGSFGAGDDDAWLAKTEVESGLAWTDSTPDTITFYRGVTDPWWNYVRVRIWKIKE